jgi:hypothetical protein
MRALAAAVVATAIAACGGHEEKPPTSPSTTGSVAEAPPTTPAADLSASPPPASTTPPPTVKGKIHSFDLAATSGKVDKVGSQDAALKPDGVKDVVFDVEMEGPAVAFVIVSVNPTGQPDGAFSADTYVGSQTPPSEASVEMKPGKETSGIVVYENDKVLNAKDGSLGQLGAGPHKLVLYVSSKGAPLKGSFRAYAIFDDKSVVESPVAGVK